MENQKPNKIPYVQAKIDNLITDRGSLKAYATLTIANCFMVHNVKIIEGKNGMFVSMPNNSYVDKNGDVKYVDICHSIVPELTERIKNITIAAYNKAVGVNNNVAVNKPMAEQAKDVVPFEVGELDSTGLPFELEDDDIGI